MNSLNASMTTLENIALGEYKFIMHWLGPYEVKTITDGGVCTTERLRRYRNRRNDQWELTKSV
jgi:hypothetical protein